MLTYVFQEGPLPPLVLLMDLVGASHSFEVKIQCTRAFSNLALTKDPHLSAILIDEGVLDMCIILCGSWKEDIQVEAIRALHNFAMYCFVSPYLVCFVSDGFALNCAVFFHCIALSRFVLLRFVLFR